MKTGVRLTLAVVVTVDESEGVLYFDPVSSAAMKVRNAIEYGGIGIGTNGDITVRVVNASVIQ